MHYKKFEDLTKEERSKICNGCGGKGSWVRPPHGIFFKASCDHHDYGYWKGGGEVARMRCDKNLYKAMIEDCKSLPWYRWARYRPWCWAYYVAVRMCGAKYFNYKEIV